MIWESISAYNITANGYELERLGSVKNVEIIGQARRILGNPEDLRWETENCKVEEGDIVVEIGACIGLFSLLAGMQGASRLISFEPNIANHGCATLNAGLGFAGRRPEFRVINAAVCDYDGIAPFYDAPAIGQHGMFKYERNLHAREVDTWTLDTLFRKNMVKKIDFLKCDGNGAEYLIFAGLSDTNLKKIRRMSVQYHHQVADASPGWREKFLERLHGFGYETETGPTNSYGDDWLRAWKK